MDKNVAVKCVICDKNLSDEQTVTLRSKGSQGINKASALRGSDIRTQEGQSVHSKCRKTWCNPNNIEAFKKAKPAVSTSNEPVLRSQVEKFQFNKHCLFCGQEAKYDGRKRGCDVFPVRTHALHATIINACTSRDDEWSKQVLARVVFAEDLPAVDAIYHNQCNVNFRNGKAIPTRYVPQNEASNKKLQLKGRPEQDERTNSFLAVIQNLKNNDEDQITIRDLVKRMEANLESSGSECHAYSEHYMKQKVTELLGDNVIFTNMKGRTNVVTFRASASSILHQYYNTPKGDNEEAEKQRIIETAAKLIRSDVKSFQTSNDFYPLTADMASVDKAMDLLPDSLQVFMKTVIGVKNDKKSASIGQAIMQAIKPRYFIAPLQLGLAVQMHHHFGSRFLIDSLHQHGFCSSYSEVQKYERSASTTSNLDTLIDSHQFVQYVADNIDHNINTLDGHGTFHGMGSIAAVTPGSIISRAVPKKVITTHDLITAGRIKIIQYQTPKSLKELKFKELECMRSLEEPLKLQTDTLWKIAPFVSYPRPGWSSFMHMIHKGHQHPGKSSVVFLPLIDLEPSNMSCIYSTLLFLNDQASKNSCTSVVTFDQPLWWKALSIIENEAEGSNLKEVILLLGGLHTEMSFLGCIGHLMINSGLKEILEQIYGSNAVIHMLSGKALSRARRGHMLVDAALNILAITEALKISLPRQWITPTGQEQDDTNRELLLEDDTESVRDDMNGLIVSAAEIYNKVMSDKGVDDQCLDDKSRLILLDINSKIESIKDKYKVESRTGRLWVQYMTMVDVLKNFIRAERTGDWNLHLLALNDMLPYFAAAGHNLYTNTVYVHLQKMQQLKKSHPILYGKFQKGLHVVRRSNEYWAGLSSDLIIEQALMRSIKSTGGLTRGRGMTEAQRQVWVQSMIPCTEVNNAMQEFTTVMYNTSEQHKEASYTRQTRDCLDTRKILTFLLDRSPFTTDEPLRSLTSGVVAHGNVNVDKAKEAGDLILQSMHGQNIWNYSFKRNLQAVTMGSKNIKVGQDVINIDPQLLFQRLAFVSEQQDIDKRGIFKYELCSYPSSLFADSVLPRKANKSALANAMWAKVEKCQISASETPLSDPLYVLDGGALLHRLSWSVGMLFSDICNSYTEYVLTRYGKSVVIVFDGYLDGPSIKDATHIRRSEGKSSPNVFFSMDMKLTMKKDIFLSNKRNKQRFLMMLSESFESVGCQTIHARGDADLLITQTAVSASEQRDVVVIADDTDVLILLCFYVKMETKKVIFKPEPKRGTTNIRQWNIQATKSSLGLNVCNGLLFIHAILGCDTTSQLFGIGKGKGLKKIMKNTSFMEYAEVFNYANSLKEDIITAGENAIVAMYGGKRSDTLDELRYRCFSTKVANKNMVQAVQAQSLPPTSAAAKFHNLRVYFQVQDWKGNTSLLPEHWGWQVQGGQLLPVLTDLQPAPPVLLDIIRCKCKTNCSNSRCSCRKHGLECSSACSECHGILCSNSNTEDVYNDGVSDGE